MENKKLREQLHNLLLVLKENIVVYKKAADNATCPEYKERVIDHVIRRYKDVNDLRSAIRKAWGDTKDLSPGPWSKLTSLWLDVKTTISNNEELTMIEASQVSTRKVIKEYERVLKDPGLPPEWKQQLRKQWSGIGMGSMQAEFADEVHY